MNLPLNSLAPYTGALPVPATAARQEVELDVPGILDALTNSRRLIIGTTMLAP